MARRCGKKIFCPGGSVTKYNAKRRVLTMVLTLTTEEYKQILFDPYGDTTLKELEESKHNIKNVNDLIKFLDFAISHNYYTGNYWNYLYNFNDELEKIVLGLGLDDDYLKYLTHYADAKGDIFIFSKFDFDQYAATGSELDDKIKFIASKYDRILSPEEFDSFYICDKYDYVHEIYNIPDGLDCFIDYEKIYHQLTWDEGIEDLNNDSFILFEVLD